LEKQTQKIAICHHTLAAKTRRVFSEEHCKHLSDALLGHPGYGKGKNYAEMYGQEKARELCKLRSQERKGKRLEEIYGIDRAKRLREKLSEYAKDRPESVRRKISESLKRGYKEGKIKNPMSDPLTRRKVSEKLKGRSNFWSSGEKNPAKRLEVRAKISKNNAMKNPVYYRKWLSIIRSKKYREKMSESISKNPTYPKPKYIPTLGHFVRSSWEEVICKQLKKDGILYTYEFPITYMIGNITKHYVADILIQTRSGYKIIIEPHGPTFERGLS
jgi:hypothetical protein